MLPFGGRLVRLCLHLLVTVSYCLSEQTLRAYLWINFCVLYGASLLALGIRGAALPSQSSHGDAWHFRVPRRAVSGRKGARPPWGGSLPAACQSRLFPPPRGLGLTTALHPTPFPASCPRLKSTESLILESPFIWYPAAHSSCHSDSHCLLGATLDSLASLATARGGPAHSGLRRMPPLWFLMLWAPCVWRCTVPWPAVASWSFCHLTRRFPPGSFEESFSCLIFSLF